MKTITLKQASRFPVEGTEKDLTLSVGTHEVPDHILEHPHFLGLKKSKLAFEGGSVAPSAGELEKVKAELEAAKAKIAELEEILAQDPSDDEGKSKKKGK